jgi:formate dehydrogenase subunit beta
VAAFLRPCEVRAFVELTKLKQGSLERTLLVGMDCLGRYETTDYLKLADKNENLTMDFLKAAGNGKGTSLDGGIDIAAACRTCDTPVAGNVDLVLQVIGHESGQSLGLESRSEAGDRALEALGLGEGREPEGRKKAVVAITEARNKARDSMRSETREKIKSIDGLMEIIAPCINCYNCRVACPVCYCRECVFVTDTFRHDSRQYAGWAEKRGRLRMPTDTLFYHLTRMMHMSTLCVGCGQCSSACPNDIPLSDLFTTVAEGAQGVFGYVPGRDPQEAQPLADFREDELVEVTGQVK